jgi:NADP-dependent 3-hydroxy acid dehydrogenase YdfG
VADRARTVEEAAEMIDLTGRVAVVLGAGTGVGQAATLALARAGW